MWIEVFLDFKLFWVQFWIWLQFTVIKLKKELILFGFWILFSRFQT
jgi:hypothetical protein